MRKKRRVGSTGPTLFDVSQFARPPGEPKVGVLRHPIWTENKARLIQRYLYYFVLITKHGTYVDGFAGPQELEKPETWAAKLVLESEPRWLRNFYLYDENAQKAERLRTLKENQTPRRRGEPQRSIHVRRGDFNRLVFDLLASSKITETEATFCLLDQQTFECQWRTVEALAGHKKSGNKIELFYFLPNSWFERAVAGLKDRDVLQAWWGKEDYETMATQLSTVRRDLFLDRFRELGYGSVKPWPIYERKEGGKIHYYMVTQRTIQRPHP